MSDVPARRGRLPDLNATREAREANGRQEAHVEFPRSSMPPEKLAGMEERMRRDQEVRRQAEERLAAVRLTPREDALVRVLGGARLLWGDASVGLVVGRGRERSVPYLVAQLYGAKWSRLSRRSRTRMFGRLRTLRHRANAKLAGLSLAIVPDVFGVADWCLARTDLYDWRQGREKDLELLRPAGRVPRDETHSYAPVREPKRAAVRLRAVPVCGAYLLRRLASGPVQSREVLRECRVRGFSPSTVKNARQRLRIVATHGEGYGANGQWWLSLPGRP
jgi:hypothetical protein